MAKKKSTTKGRWGVNKLAILSVICMVCLLLGGVGAFVYLHTAYEEKVPSEPDGEGEQTLLTDPAPLAAELDLPFLQTVQRVPYSSRVWQTNERRPYTGDPHALLNEHTKTILAAFGVTLGTVDSITETVDAEGRPAYELQSGGVGVWVDREGELVYFKDYDQVPEDYFGEEFDLQYTTEEELADILAALEAACELSEYQRTVCVFDGFRTVSVRWEKQVAEGLTNPYDYVAVDVHAETGQVTAFYRLTGMYEPNAIQPLVRKGWARAFAKPVIQEQTVVAYETETPKLRLVRPNFRWEEGGPWAEADFVRLAWSVEVLSLGSVDGSAGQPIMTVWIDARTGEVLGGEKL